MGLIRTELRLTPLLHQIDFSALSQGNGKIMRSLDPEGDLKCNMVQDIQYNT
jgi:hypothetical protein